MRVTSLHVYPVKSTAPSDLDTAAVEPWGLAGDRRWVVVDGAGDQVTARERPALLSVRALVRGDALTLSAPDVADLTLHTRALPGPLREIRLFRTPFEATDAGDGAASWFTGLLGVPVRLMYLDDPTRRPLPATRGGLPGDAVNAADTHPLLLTSLASLGQVNRWIAERRAEEGEPPADPLPMRRFRPNVVVDSGQPFAEDDWTKVTIGDLDFRVVERCKRCVMTTIDPWTLEVGNEPLRTFARHRRWDGGTWFGVKLVPLGPGVVSVGAEVRPV